VIIRIVHGTARDVSDGASVVDPAGGQPHRERLNRAAGRVDGLETLIVGWRGARDPDSGAATPPSVVVTAWRDVESMVSAIGRDEPSSMRERLGLDVTIDRAESYEVTSRTFASLPAPTAVLRILTLGAIASGESALFERLRDVQQRLTSHGLVASHVARRVTSDGIEALVVGVWSDDAAIDAATAGQPERPAYPAELEPWIKTVSIETYRAMEIAPRLPMASGPPIIVLDEGRHVVDLTPAAAAAVGRTQEEAVGMLAEELATHGDPEASGRWARLVSGDDADGDRTGETAWAVPFGGVVMIRWRLRRNAPVQGRHTLLVHRLQEGTPGPEDLDAALAAAFPPDTPGTAD
jgi:PAS domain-containing protein